LAGTLTLAAGEGGADSITLSCYDFQITGDQAALMPAAGPPLILERISGSPQAFSLRNPLIGEWSAEWAGVHGRAWSFKYRSDGTVKAFHHEAGHQFENAYALRGTVLIIFGGWRFGSAPVQADLTPREGGGWTVKEAQANPPPSDWTYTKVDAPEWR
jgi:hypothetical protein